MFPPATTRRSLMSPSWSHPRLRKQWPVRASGRSISGLGVHGEALGSRVKAVFLLSVLEGIF